MLKANNSFPAPGIFFSYLEFIEDRSGLFFAIKSLIDGGHFKKTDCIKDFECGPNDPRSNINNVSGTKLFEFIEVNFLKPAIAANEQLAYQAAFDISRDSALLARSVDFESNLTSESYDKVLSVGAFLSREKTKYGQTKPTDIKTLLDVIEGETVDTTTVNDRAIGAYITGIQLLRNNCFTEASNTFFEASNFSTEIVLKELFSFLSLRTASRPFIDLSKLEIGSDGIFVRGCIEMRSAKELTDLYKSRKQVLYSHIIHKGLKPT